MKKFLILGFVSLIALNASAQEKKTNINPSSKGSTSNAPVNIESDSLVYEGKSGAAVFTGNVKVTQDNMDLTADEMKVFSEKKVSTKKGSEDELNADFKKIEAKGNVKFKGKELYGNSDFANYDISDELLTLTGNVYINQNGNELYGEKFIYNMKTAKYNVYNSPEGVGVSGSKRIKLILKQEAGKGIELESSKKFKEGSKELKDK